MPTPHTMNATVVSCRVLIYYAVPDLQRQRLSCSQTLDDALLSLACSCAEPAEPLCSLAVPQRDIRLRTVQDKH